MNLRKKIVRAILGKKRFQNIFEYLFEISLKGMNYGNGGDFYESGELNALNYVKEKLKSEKSLTLFDVGGNVGNYSKRLSEIFNTNSTIHSFEPSKKTFALFLETTKNNPSIIPNNLGLSDTESHQLLFSDKDGSGLASVYQRKLEHLGISMNMSEDIQLTTLDIYCKRNKIDRINFLKLDIEGHELKALNGAKEMINNKKIDYIQFEFGGCNIDSKTYFQDYYYLLKNNYKIYRILKNGISEITTYKEIFEIFSTINYLAIRK
jgi:FkbM family methyltransferase